MGTSRPAANPTGTGRDRAQRQGVRDEAEAEHADRGRREQKQREAGRELVRARSRRRRRREAADGSAELGGPFALASGVGARLQLGQVEAAVRVAVPQDASARRPFAVADPPFGVGGRRISSEPALTPARATARRSAAQAYSAPQTIVVTTASMQRV